MGGGTNGKSFAALNDSHNLTKYFEELSLWRGVAQIVVTWKAMSSEKSGRVVLEPTLSKWKAWAKQLSSCKCVQVDHDFTTETLVHNTLQG